MRSAGWPALAHDDDQLDQRSPRLPAAEVLEELRQRVAAAEVAIAAERQRTGQRVYGRRAVLRQAWWERPTSFEPRRNLRPRVAARSQWARIEALQRNRVFLVDYAAARDGWRCGATVAFPAGTYWLRHRAQTRLVGRLRGEGKSLRQIAEVVGVSEKAIRKQLRRLLEAQAR